MNYNMDMTFLVVDDDSQVRDIIVQYLKSFGFTNIIEAKDGSVGLKFVRNPSQVIDFIISDWEMPKVDGLTLLRAVRKENYRKGTKFLMVTSQGSHERMKITKAAKARVDGYMVKPFRADGLKEKVFNILNNGTDTSAEEFNTQILGEESNAGSVTIVAGDLAPKSDVQVINQQRGAVGEVSNSKVYIGGPFNPKKPPEYFDAAVLDAESVNRLANCYKKIKKYDLAVELCRQAYNKFSDNADIIFNLGYCLYLREQYEEAEKYLSHLIQLKPYHVEARSVLAEIYKILNKAS